MASNPFVQRGMIRNTRYFYGRKRELRKVFNHLRGEQAQCCALIGDSKIGKSSFLQYISDPTVRQAEGLYSEKHIFVHFDFQHNLEISRPYFWGKILNCLLSQVGDHQLSRNIANICNAEDFSKNIIEELMRILRDEEFKLYFLFDEFECIVKSPDLFNTDFLSELRFLTNHYNLVYIVATEVELEHLILEGFGSPFPNVFAPIRLGLLDESETRELIQQAKNPVEPSLHGEESFIMHLAGCHPFLTQLVCYHLFDLKVGRGALTKGNYETVIEESLADARPFFRGDLWPLLTEMERQLLISIAWNQQVDSKIYRVELRRLERQKQYICQRDGQLVIFSDLLRRFIREESQGLIPGPHSPPPDTRNPRLNYDNFELLVERYRKGEGYPIRVVHSPEGETQGMSSIDPESLQTELEAIVASNTDAPFLSQFGQKLGEALLVGDVRRRFDSAKPRMGERNRGLRVRLRIDPPELACLPWEFLYDKDENRWLARSSSITLSRYVEAPQPNLDLAVQLPLNILLVLSNPTDLSDYGLAKLDLEAEHDNLQAALMGLLDSNMVTLEILMEATTEAIRKKLTAEGKEYHILHFSGHGLFADGNAERLFPIPLEKGRGYLLMQWPNGRCRPLHEEILVELVKDNGLRLVVLNACRTAASSPSQQFVGLATTLVRWGPPAVIAMQYSITDEVAQRFGREFYTSLANGLPVDVCIAEARKAIAIDFDQGSRDWAIPALYMRSPDGIIFDIKSM